MKYLQTFERDWDWFYKWKDFFNFDSCSSYHNKKGEQIIVPNGTKSAKECFFLYDSQGIIQPTNEPELLLEIFRCKGSINFNIKMWSESRADGTLPWIEFEGIIKEFELLDWMIKGVERQKTKYYKNGI